MNGAKRPQMLPTPEEEVAGELRHATGDQRQLDAIIACQCALARLVYTRSGLVSLSDIPIRRSSDVTSRVTD